MLPTNRKPFQHRFNEIGESQMSACFQWATWSVTKIVADYGQDFLLHPFQDGVPVWCECFVQLKSTDDIKKYYHRQGFRYAINTVHLRQWHQSILPMFIILWDITQECGYYLHVQPLITQRVAQQPTWLDAKGQRTIVIPATHCLHKGDLGGLPIAVQRAYHYLRKQDQILNAQQQTVLAQLDAHLGDAPPLEGSFVRQPSILLPPSAKHLQSLAALQTAAQQSPHNWRIDMAIARLYYEGNSFADAMQAIQQAKSKGAIGIPYETLRASILTEYANTTPTSSRHLLIEAEAIFARLGAQLTYPAKTLNDYNQGNALKALGRFEEAIVLYDLALAHAPLADLAGKILSNKGACLFHLGRHEEEYAAYVEALNHDPHRWQALSCWAATEVRRGQPEHARELLLREIDIAPEVQQQPNETYSLAYACYHLARYDEVVQWAQKTLFYAPTHRRALRLLVLAYSHLWRQNLGHADAALAAYRQWLANEPDDLFVVKEIYLLYRELGSMDSAREIVSSTTLAQDAPAASLYYYGSMLADEGQVDAAIALLEQARALSGDRYMLHRLGHLYAQRNEHRQTIACFAALLPEGEIIHLTAIADAFHALQDYLPCIPIMLRLLTLQPDCERWWNNIEVALLNCGAITAVQRIQLILKDRTTSSETAVLTVADMLAEEGVGDFRQLRQRPWTGEDILRPESSEGDVNALPV